MEKPQRIWWEGPRRVALGWVERSDDPIIKEKMKEIAEKIEELIDLVE